VIRCYRARVAGPSGEGTATGERGLRLDALRNQERIVAAAASAFAELGADVTLDEVARRAGVGVATVYRRFRNRDQLVRAVVAHVLAAEIEPVAAVETDDPWRDLAATLEASVAAVAAHRDVVALAHAAGGIDLDVVDRYLHRLDRLLSRARAAGLVRPELEPRDVAVAVVMVLATVRRGGGRDGAVKSDVASGDWRRYLALLLDGMRPASTPLPARAAALVRRTAGPPVSSPPAPGR
jgi:AcrR family transcriptional regulator